MSIKRGFQNEPKTQCLWADAWTQGPSETLDLLCPSKNNSFPSTTQCSGRNSQWKKEGHPYLFGLDCWGTAVPTIIVAEGSVVDGVTVIVPHERLKRKKQKRLRAWTWINPATICQKEDEQLEGAIEFVTLPTALKSKRELFPSPFKAAERKKGTLDGREMSPCWLFTSHIRWCFRNINVTRPRDSIKACKIVAPFDNFKLTFQNYVG